MEPEPEPQESHQSYLNYNLEQQDILLDNIKEYRKIIRNIMDELIVITPIVKNYIEYITIFIQFHYLIMIILIQH